MNSPSIHPSTSGDTSTHVATTIKDAPKPFDGSSFSDVILRSDDSVDFFALQSLLFFVSPVFKDMLSVTKERDLIKGLPVVPVSEDSETLLCLLSLIYPHDREPRVASAALFSKVCRAARKYSMDVVERKLRGMLRGVGPSHGPDTAVAHQFLLYAIAVQFGWHAEATKAARHTISTPWREMPYNDELQNISGADFYEYLAFRKGSKTLGQAKPLPPIATATNSTKIQKPFIDAEEPFNSSAKADIILRSTDGVDFYVLRDLLNLVTPAFRDATGSCLKNELPVFNTEADSTTLRHLLSFIYPQPVENQIDDIDNFVKICRAARKYEMGIVGERLKHQLDASRHIVDDPMRALWVAIAFGWEKVAKKAAKNALALPLPISLEEELWLVSSADVYWFIQYKLACCDAACEAVLKDTLFAYDRTTEKERVFQRIIDGLKESPRGTSIKQTCTSEIQETSNEPSDYQANFLFKLLKKRDKLVTMVENAISKVPLRANCCAQGA